MKHYSKNYKRDAFILLVVCVSVLSGAVLSRIAQGMKAYAGKLPSVSFVKIEVPVEVYKSPETIEQEVRMVFGSKANEALKVMHCESGGNPKAKNKESTATGLFQIMASVHGVRRDWLMNPTVNIQIAKALYDASGWEPWRASNSCHGLLK